VILGDLRKGVSLSNDSFVIPGIGTGGKVDR
jgi:hypothetical protein